MLSEAQKAKLLAVARERGLDEGALLAAGEKLVSGNSVEGTLEGGHPLADRLLIGFLPFIRVRELRSIWLGLDESLPDDDLTCGEFQAKIAKKFGGTVPTTSGTPDDSE